MNNITHTARELPQAMAPAEAAPKETQCLPAALLGVIGSYMPQAPVKKTALETMAAMISSQSIRESGAYKEAEAEEDKQTLLHAVHTFVGKRAAARRKKELEHYEKTSPGIFRAQLEELAHISEADANAPLLCPPLQGNNVRDCSFLQPFLRGGLDTPIEQVHTIINVVKEKCPHLSAIAFECFSLGSPRPLELLHPAPELRRLTVDRSFEWYGNSPPGAAAHALAFSRFTSLYELSLDGGIAFTDADLKQVVDNLPQLQSLQLGACLHLTAQSIKTLATLHHLRHLDLKSCHAMMQNPAMQESAFRLLLQLKELRSLGLSGWNRLQDKDLEALVTACPHLEHLDLSGCDQMTKEGLFLHLEKLQNCRSICLRGWKTLVSADLERLGRALPRLEYLDLSYCPLHGNDLPLLATAFPHLKGLDMCGWSLPNTTLAPLQALRQLQRLNFYATELDIQVLQGCSNLESCDIMNYSATDADLLALKVAFHTRYGRDLILRRSLNVPEPLHEPYRVALE